MKQLLITVLIGVGFGATSLYQTGREFPLSEAKETPPGHAISATTLPPESTKSRLPESADTVELASDVFIDKAEVSTHEMAAFLTLTSHANTIKPSTKKGTTPEECHIKKTSSTALSTTKGGIHVHKKEDCAIGKQIAFSNPHE